MSRLALLLLAFTLAVPTARAQDDDDAGLDPKHIRLPGKRSLATASTGLVGNDFALFSKAGTAPLTDPEREALQRALARGLDDDNGASRLIAQRTLLRLAEGEALSSDQLVALLDDAFASPHTDSREVGAVFAGLLIRRSEDEAQRLQKDPAAKVHGFSQLLSQSKALGEVNRGPGVAVHMANAAAMNRTRKAAYSKLSNGASEEISSFLIENEESYLTTLSLNYVDWVADDFVEKGVPVASQDVIPLRPLPVDTALRYRGVSTAEQRKALATRLEAWLKTIDPLVDGFDFAGVAKQAHAMIVELQNLEAELGCHFAMTRHLVATIGYGAWRAHQRGDTGLVECWGPDFWGCTFGGIVTPESVTAGYLNITTYALPDFALEIDAAAQRIQHDHGLGIIVNEFPGGFFRYVYERDTRKR